MSVHTLVVEQTPPSRSAAISGSASLTNFPAKGIVAGDHALQVDLLHEGQSLLAAQGQVFIAECGGDVDDAGAVVHADEVGGHYAGRVGTVRFFQGGLPVGATDKLADRDCRTRSASYKGR